MALKWVTHVVTESRAINMMIFFFCSLIDSQFVTPPDSAAQLPPECQNMRYDDRTGLWFTDIRLIRLMNFPLGKFPKTASHVRETTLRLRDNFNISFWWHMMWNMLIMLPAVPIEWRRLVRNILFLALLTPIISQGSYVKLYLIFSYTFPPSM